MNVVVVIVIVALLRLCSLLEHLLQLCKKRRLRVVAKLPADLTLAHGCRKVQGAASGGRRERLKALGLRTALDGLSRANLLLALLQRARRRLLGEDVCEGLHRRLCLGFGLCLSLGPSSLGCILRVSGFGGAPLLEHARELTHHVPNHLALGGHAASTTR